MYIHPIKLSIDYWRFIIIVNYEFQGGFGDPDTLGIMLHGPPGEDLSVIISRWSCCATIDSFCRDGKNQADRGDGK